MKRVVLALSCSLVAATAAVAAPAKLEAMRKAFSAAIAAHDVKATAALTAFPLAFSGYEHPETVTAADFADEFDGLFFGGSAELAKCLATQPLEAAPPTFKNSPWAVFCDGNDYYFGERNGAWKFTAYENTNE